MPETTELKHLHTALIDARRGYEEAIEDAEKPALTALFRDMHALHDRHHEELHKLLLADGETPDESGSFMSSVHRTVIGVRSAVTGLDESALSAFASGEERIVDAYDKAIVEAQDSPQATTILSRQKGDLLAKIATMKNIAAA